MSALIDVRRASAVSDFLPLLVCLVCLIGTPYFAGPAIVSLMTKVLIYALLVASLDLLVGFAGLWTFGHAAFFALGAYSSGILITEFDYAIFWQSSVISLVIVGVAATVLGAISLRVSGVYFLLITLAMGQLVFGMLNTSTGLLGSLTGGSDGLLGIPYPDFGFAFNSTRYYFFALAVVACCTLGLYRLIHSPFGYALRGIREDEIRLGAMGYNVMAFKLAAIVIAAILAGVAGILFGHFNGFISPNMASLETSGLLWLMIIVGGAGTLWGAFLGSFSVLVLQYFVSAWTPERWQLILGLLFVAAVMTFRQGLYPALIRFWAKRSAR